MIRSALFIVAYFYLLSGFSQQKLLVRFTDKDGMSLDPYVYFDAKAIERRTKHNIPLVTFSDLPVRPDYITQTNGFFDSTKVITRWLNGIIGYTSPEKTKFIRQLPFVQSVDVMNTPKLFTCSRKGDTLTNAGKNLLHGQLDRMGHKAFRSRNITGNGVRVAIFDVGFKNVDINKAFSHIREANKIIATKNFVNEKKSVYQKGFHGTNVLSCIAGKNGDEEIGLAIHAEFLLAKTERLLWEPYSEEENWLAAAEWADKNGADIISSSLGYGYHRYFLEDMDGHTSLVSEAARFATRKGILVVNSAGNEATNSWGHIITPADVDSVMCVGGLDPFTGIGIVFTSLGPSADYTRKPNVISFGSVIASGAKEWVMTQGTSFSCPLISGYAACIMQHNPSLTNMEVFDAIEKSADLYPYFDYRHGYGVPVADIYFHGHDTVAPTFRFEKYSASRYDCVISDKAMDRLEALRKNEPDRAQLNIGNTTVPDDYQFFMNDYVRSEKRECLYYKVVDGHGKIVYYEVMEVYDKLMLQLDPEDLPEGGKIVVHLLGYTAELKR